MNNKISIIIPVYNLESYIEKTVKSVLQQTYSNIEVIIVDDGSTDESWEKIKNIEKTDKRVIAIHQKNNGVTSARLNGIKYSTGQWIGFVDGDDEIETDMYQVLIDMAVRWKADISHCGYQMVFEDGRIHYFHNTGNIIQQDKVKGIRDLLEGEIIEPGLCNKLFKKSLFRDLFDKNVIPTDIKINEDLLMNYYLFMHSNKAVFIDVCKYHYLVRSTSATRKGLNHSRIYDPITVKKIILNDVSEELKKCALKSLSLIHI